KVEGRRERRDVDVRQEVEAVDVEHGEAGGGDRLLHGADQRGIADDGMIGKAGRRIEPQPNPLVAGVRCSLDIGEGRRVGDRARSEDEGIDRHCVMSLAGYSGLRPAALTTPPQRPVSDVMNAPNSGGVKVIASAPSVENRALTAGSARLA